MFHFSNRNMYIMYLRGMKVVDSDVILLLSLLYFWYGGRPIHNAEVRPLPVQGSSRRWSFDGYLLIVFTFTKTLKMGRLNGEPNVSQSI